MCILPVPELQTVEMHAFQSNDPYCPQPPAYLPRHASLTDPAGLSCHRHFAPADQTSALQSSRLAHNSTKNYLAAGKTDGYACNYSTVLLCADIPTVLIGHHSNNDTNNNDNNTMSSECLWCWHHSHAHGQRSHRSSDTDRCCRKPSLWVRKQATAQELESRNVGWFHKRD